MWKFRHFRKIDFLCQYKNIARVFRETTYFHALKNTRSCRGKVERRHARNYFPWGAKTWLYDALLCNFFYDASKNSTNIKKLKSLSESKIQTHFYTWKHVSYTKKTSACLRSIPWLCHCTTRFPQYSVGFANTLAIFFRYKYLAKYLEVL